MKKLLLAAFLLMSVFGSVYAEGSKKIDWHNYSKEVFGEAKDHKQTVMLFAMSDTCPWCEKMESTTFQSSAIIKMVNENFYPVILHVNKNYAEAKKLKLSGVPTIIFFNDDGKVKNKYSGYKDPEVMMQNLTENIPAS
jgi:thioredoxin-related protein